MNKKILIIIIIILILGVFVSMKWKDIYHEGLSWAAFFRQNPSICDKIQDQEKKESCYLGATEQGQDLSICDRIKNQEKKDYCFTNVTMYNPDLSICDRVQDQGTKNFCYSNVARSKQDLSICDKIENQQEYKEDKSNCYIGVAVVKQDLSVCDKIEDQWMKDGCYTNVAFSKQDLSICDKIEDQKEKDDCYRYVTDTWEPTQTIIKISSWLVWIGMVLIFTGGLPASYVWYGKILGIVEKERAKKIWIFGTALSILGLILILLPIILGVPEETEVQEEVAKAWFLLFWVAVGLLLIGALLFGLVAQSWVLDMVKLEIAQKVFKISFIIMSIGAVILLWVMMPGNMLPDGLPSFTIEQVKEKYESELMAIKGVVGVGIGKCEDKFCIKVYLGNDSPELKKRIPAQLDGFKVDTEITGPIEALPIETYSGGFLYEIKSCGGTEELKNNSVDIEVLDNSIKFTQILNTYCNADKNNLRLEYNRQGNVLEINEIFKSLTVAKCVCPLEIIGTISNLEKGVYKIKFIFDNQYVNQKEVINMLEFEIK